MPTPPIPDSRVSRKARFLALALAVVAINNLSILWAPATAFGPGPIDTLIKGALWVAILAWTIRVGRYTAADLGLSLDHLASRARLGALVGVGMALPAVLFLRFPVVSTGPVRVGPLSGIDRELLPLGIAAIVLVNLTAVFEELLFRGLFQKESVRLWGTRKGIALTCGLFILWHVVVVYHALQQASLIDARVPWPVLYVLAALPLGAAGLIFSLLRLRTHTLVAPTVAHWLADAILQSVVLISSVG